MKTLKELKKKIIKDLKVRKSPLDAKSVVTAMAVDHIADEVSQATRDAINNGTIDIVKDATLGGEAISLIKKQKLNYNKFIGEEK